MKKENLFTINYIQWLDEHGNLSESLPPFIPSDLSTLVDGYKTMTLTRIFDQKAVALQRTGQLGTYASSLGQEAIGVAIGSIMENDDVFVPYYRDYSANNLPRLIRPLAMEKLLWHKSKGHGVVIVSASFDCYLSIWCTVLGADLIATKMETKDSRLTGKLATKNCYGEEKIRRIKEKYDLNNYEYIYAYGDTKGDLPLKTIANEFHYKPFR